MINLTTTNEDYTARWTPANELAEGNPPANDAGEPCKPQRGIVELFDAYGETVADEWADTAEAAQAWVDDFDFAELEAYEPDFDFDEDEGRYFRCG